jgi:AbrB family looped-hinge helix DNA binding protein
MSDPGDDAVTVRMNREGRLVVPRSIRDEAGISAGMPLRIRVRDGRIEIDPPTARYRTVKRHGFLVAEPVGPLPPLSNTEARSTLRRLRERRGR